MFIVLPLPEEKGKIYGYQMTIRVKYMQDIQIFLFIFYWIIIMRESCVCFQLNVGLMH